MFEEVAGLPAHPLIIHAVVVFVPLLALGSIIYAVLPSMRPRIRWVVAVLAPVAAGAAVAAKLSGDAFRQRLVSQNPGFDVTDIDRHRGFGNMTMALTILLAVVVLALLAAAPARIAASDAGDGPRSVFLVRVLLSVVTVALAVGALYYVIRTGDSGARMVWGNS